MSRIFAAVIAAALCTAQVAAQEAPSAPLTLDAALDAARQISPALEAASADLRASSAAPTDHAVIVVTSGAAVSPVHSVS